MTPFRKTRERADEALDAVTTTADRLGIAADEAARTLAMVTLLAMVALFVATYALLAASEA